MPSTDTPIDPIGRRGHTYLYSSSSLRLHIRALRGLRETVTVSVNLTGSLGRLEAAWLVSVTPNDQRETPRTSKKKKRKPDSSRSLPSRSHPRSGLSIPRNNAANIESLLPALHLSILGVPSVLRALPKAPGWGVPACTGYALTGPPLGREPRMPRLRERALRGQRGDVGALSPTREPSGGVGAVRVPGAHVVGGCGGGVHGGRRGGRRVGGRGRGLLGTRDEGVGEGLRRGDPGAIGAPYCTVARVGDGVGAPVVGGGHCSGYRAVGVPRCVLEDGGSYIYSMAKVRRMRDDRGIETNLILVFVISEGQVVSQVCRSAGAGKCG
ncbi:hypothetical protein VUR80DRAFT_9625 [Thermomyces stellatus]